MAWRGSVEDIDSLDSPHSRDTDCVPITRRPTTSKKKSNVSILSSRIYSSKHPLWKVRKGCTARLTTQNSSFSLSQRLTQGGEREIDGWIDERILETDFTTRRADNGNPLSVTENFRGRESRLLGRGFLKMEGNPVKIERQ